MVSRVCPSALAASLIGMIFFTSSPVLAQVSSPASPATAPTAAQITSFSQAVGINETCTRSFLAASYNKFPQGLSDLNQFVILAPAAALCTPAAVASAQNNTPAPTDLQIAAYAQTTGVNQTCIRAFVLHDNSLPADLTELTQFRQAAPSSDLCTQTAVASAQAGS